MSVTTEGASDNVTGLCHRFGMCHGVCASDATGLACGASDVTGLACVMGSVRQMSCHVMLKLLLLSPEARSDISGRKREDTEHCRGTQIPCHSAVGYVLQICSTTSLLKAWWC